MLSQRAVEETFQSLNPRPSGDTRSSGFDRDATIQVPYTRAANALGWINGHYDGGHPALFPCNPSPNPNNPSNSNANAI